jgi:recombination protein RecA
MLQEKLTENKSVAAELEEYKDRGIKKILYIDLEHTFDEEWSEKLGVDPEHIEIMQPPNVVAEEILNTALELIETGEMGLLVIDSIPSLIPESKLKKKLGEKTVAALAGLMTDFLIKAVPLLDRYDCTMILINQNRDNLINPYAVNTPGGQAVKFYSSLMLEFSIGNPVDFLGNELPQKSANPAGYIINVRLTKQKTAPFDRKNASYYLMAQSGIRKDIDLAQTALTKYDLIKKSGAWFTFANPFTGEILDDPETGKVLKVQGMAKVYEYLNSHQEYYDMLEKYITSDTNMTSFDTLEDFEE